VNSPRLLEPLAAATFTTLPLTLVEQDGLIYDPRRGGAQARGLPRSDGSSRALTPT
jgi:hypothetical protein